MQLLIEMISKFQSMFNYLTHNIVAFVSEY
jgi:hypothetical protein